MAAIQEHNLVFCLRLVRQDKYVVHRDALIISLCICRNDVTTCAFDKTVAGEIEKTDVTIAGEELFDCVAQVCSGQDVAWRGQETDGKIWAAVTVSFQDAGNCICVRDTPAQRGTRVVIDANNKSLSHGHTSGALSERVNKILDVRPCPSNDACVPKLGWFAAHVVTMHPNAYYRNVFFFSALYLPTCAIPIWGVLANKGNYSVAAFDLTSTICFPLRVPRVFHR